MRLLESSTLSNQDLSSALLVHTYTAGAAREVFIRLFADQVQGNGDYSAYITIQRGGAGSAYKVEPVTTATVASGVTAIAMTTIPFPVTSGDVVKVYLLGVAGDTTTPDIITEVWEGAGLEQTLAELAQAKPPATPTGAQALMLVYMALRNQLDVTASEKAVYNDAGAKIAAKAITDDNTTYSEAQMEAGV